MINPSTNNSANYIKKIPFIYPKDDVRIKVETLVGMILSSLEQGNFNVEQYKLELDEIFSELYFNSEEAYREKCNRKNIHIRQLNFLDVMKECPENIVENPPLPPRSV